MTQHNAEGWIKASLSDQTGNCVEMRRADESVQIRDSKHPEGAVLKFTKSAFLAWVHGARDGDFTKLI